MNCKQYRTEIEESQFAAGRRGASAESHAASCAECRDFGDERAALRRLVAGLPRVDAPADFEFRLRARMSVAEAAQPRPWSRTLLPRAAWLTAAGCLALIAALALQTRNSQTPAAREAHKTTAHQTASRPASEPSSANPAAVVSAGAVPRDTPGGKGGEVAAGEVTTSGGVSDEPFVARRAAGGAADAARSSQRKPAASAAAQPFRGAVAASVGRGAVTETNTSSMTGGPVVVSSAIPLPVSVDEQPLRVLFKDVQGASRVVNVAPVAFGSNEPAARATNVTYTKAAKKQGVW